MNKRCSCNKAKKIQFYEYIKHEHRPDLKDEYHYEFKPNFCPWCGKRLIIKPKKTIKKITKGYKNSQW